MTADTTMTDVDTDVSVIVDAFSMICHSIDRAKSWVHNSQDWDTESSDPTNDDAPTLQDNIDAAINWAQAASLARIVEHEKSIRALSSRCDDLERLALGMANEIMVAAKTQDGRPRPVSSEAVQLAGEFFAYQRKHNTGKET